ncbi:putative F-box protein At3g21120 [Salvia hispanica]|uniref:putative F-box protein At3g21120 n=1 Tax=Salvia hispanica TaxID=49212 RepID=UPI00200927E6|nr:putative F-box protein At3g21120 [Salvia hispanica]XP_047979524.1 putative F-box protein At3g21120 [Salvia hispanica]
MDSNFPNHDVVTEILLHCPFTSLLRFRSVCKSWRDHIDSEPFRKSHIHHHANDDRDDETLLVQFSFRKHGVPELSVFNGKLHNNSLPATQEILDYHLKHGLDTREVDVRCALISGPSSNGLICAYYRATDAPIAVCNPSLGLTAILPLPPKPSSNHLHTLCREVAIWFDEVAQDYAVVQLLSCYGVSFHLHASVYSKATNSWKELSVGGSDVIARGLCVVFPISSRCKDGSFSHWLAFDEEGNEVIVSFDFRNEGFRVLKITGFEILLRRGYKRIFAEGDDSFLVFNSGDQEEAKWLNMSWFRVEENRLQLDRMKRVGTFNGLVITKALALCERGCVVLEAENGCLVLYDYCNEKFLKCFEMESNVSMIFEYRGSFVLP